MAIAPRAERQCVPANASAGPPQHLDFLDFFAIGSLMTSIMSSPAGVSVPPSGPSTFWGVDVASGHLDVCLYGSNTARRIANTPSAIDVWLRSLAPGCAIAMESTGSYHRPLAEAAHAAGLAVYLLNPRDVRMYARGLGARGKTDRLDAQVLARYAA